MSRTAPDARELKTLPQDMASWLRGRKYVYLLLPTYAPNYLRTLLLSVYSVSINSLLASTYYELKQYLM